MNQNITIITILIVIIVVLAVTFGIIYGVKEKKEKKDDNTLFVNSYDNTEELIKKFPINNSTTVLPGLETKIQNRLLTGFENWNRGYDAWKAWGDILYTKKSIYTVHGVILTLEHYQQLMDETLKQNPINMGAFHNIIINGNFTAIHYDIYSGENKTKDTVMEFVQFQDYGEILGTRVVEGWGSTKKDENTFKYGLRFQDPEVDGKKQAELNETIMNYEIKMDKKDLKERYPINFPTEYIEKEKAELFINIILEGFDKWNQNINDYLEWINTNYFENATINLDETKLNKTQYKKNMEELAKKEEIKKLYFENILIRDNWAALHYRYVSTNQTDNSKDYFDSMEFLFFQKISDNEYKIAESWIK